MASRSGLSPAGTPSVTPEICASETLRARGDLQERGRFGLDLERGVVDAEARVQDDVKLLEDLVGRRAGLDHDMSAHGLAPRGERPHVQIVDAAHANGG